METHGKLCTSLITMADNITTKRLFYIGSSQPSRQNRRKISV